MASVAIAPATAADLDAIVALELLGNSHPWPRSLFEDELARPHAHLDVGRAADHRVIAFCNWWCVVGEVHVHAITAHPDVRRAGIGTQLLAHMLARGREAGALTATLEVRRGNGPAIALYTRAGFLTVHVRARYYADNDEDALVMTRSM